MSPEDMQRFEVEPITVRTGAPSVWLACDRCRWIAVYDEPLTLAELVQRAGEHTEVCP